MVTQTSNSKAESGWNVMAHGDVREGKWKGNWRMEWVAGTLRTTSEHGVFSITTADAHNSAASCRQNWPLLRRFKWTRPFGWKTKSGLCACAIAFQTQAAWCNTVKNMMDLSSFEFVRASYYFYVVFCNVNVEVFFFLHLSFINTWQGKGRERVQTLYCKSICNPQDLKPVLRDINKWLLSAHDGTCSDVAVRICKRNEHVQRDNSACITAVRSPSWRPAAVKFQRTVVNTTCLALKPQPNGGAGM